MDSVQNYILEQSEDNQKIMLFFHELLMSFPEVTNKIRYKIPFYYRKSWVLYLNPQKTKGVEICFIHGQKLSNEHNLLERKDRKQIAGITFKKISEIPEEIIFEIIQEAFLLDDFLKK